LSGSRRRAIFKIQPPDGSLHPKIVTGSGVRRDKGDCYHRNQNFSGNDVHLGIPCWIAYGLMMHMIWIWSQVLLSNAEDVAMQCPLLAESGP